MREFRITFSKIKIREDALAFCSELEKICRELDIYFESMIEGKFVLIKAEPTEFNQIGQKLMNSFSKAIPNIMVSPRTGSFNVVSAIPLKKAYKQGFFYGSEFVTNEELINA